MFQMNMSENKLSFVISLLYSELCIFIVSEANLLRRRPLVCVLHMN